MMTKRCLVVVALLIFRVAAGMKASLRRELQTYPCDPERCILVTYTFNRASTECGSCQPYDGKYHCPADNSNVYKAAMAATFGGDGFGNWQMGQCEHASYSQALFSGPSAWADHLVPACPNAEYCACGSLKAKIEQVFWNRNELSVRERSDAYWASLADGFTLAKGLSDVSGGSEEHFDLIYTHNDGRRQFCSMPQSFTYAPQLQHNPGPHTFHPKTYETGCHLGGCDEHYTEVSSSYCWWPPVFNERCQPKPSAAALRERTQHDGDAAIKQAPDVPREWMDVWGPWGQCSESCDGGTQSRSKYPTSGSGRHAADPWSQPIQTQSRACNTHSCPWYCTFWWC